MNLWMTIKSPSRIALIVSDLVDVDDMVEISGQTGIVKEIGMRFIRLKNCIGADVFIPNRIITNVVSFPRGYVRCLLDVRLSDREETALAVHSGRRLK